MSGLRHSLAPLAKAKLDSTGVTTIEKNNAPSRAKAMVHAMGRKRRPSTRCKVKIGRKAVMVMTMA